VPGSGAIWIPNSLTYFCHLVAYQQVCTVSIFFSTVNLDQCRRQWRPIRNASLTRSEKPQVINGIVSLTTSSRKNLPLAPLIEMSVILLASMVANCRCLEDRIPGCQFLAIITGSENTYFERSFESLKCGTAEEQRNRIPDAACTQGFIHLMTTVAKEGSLG
jgi:hypothetical protein